MALLKESSSLMLGQYFKKKRDLVETFFTAATGLGLALLSAVIKYLMRLVLLKDNTVVVLGDDN